MKLAKAGYKCQRCVSVFNLEVHHLRYRKIYNVKLKDLMVLCRYCHSLCHANDTTDISNIKNPIIKKFPKKKKQKPFNTKDNKKLKNRNSIFRKYRKCKVARTSLSVRNTYEHKHGPMIHY